MKVFTRVLTLTLVVILLALSLTACAGKRVTDGEYILGDKALTGCYESYTFEKKNFSYTTYIQHVKQEELSYSGTYKLEIVEPEDEEQKLEDEENMIKRGNIIFTWTDANGEKKTETKAVVIDEYEWTLTMSATYGDLIYTYYSEEE